MKQRLKPFKSWRLALDGNRGSSSTREEPPLREELFSVDQLETHAKNLAEGHEVVERSARRGKDRLLPRLSENEELLRAAHGLVSDAAARGQRITPAAEWFLDNYTLIEEQILIARKHLPAGYSRDLPQLSSGPLAGYPRVYALALALISHVDGRLDGETMRAFVSAYQSVSALRLGELWAIPIMLRLALLENLRRVVARITAGRRDRERAGYWIDRMLKVAVNAPREVVVVLAEMVKENPPLTTAFISEFASRMQGEGATLSFPMTWLGHRIAEQGQTIETVFQLASQNQAADQVSIGNSIGSLRFLGAMDWRDFVEAMSATERILRTDPAEVYERMDFGTRDRYRHAVEAISRRSVWSEEQVADRAVEMAWEQAAALASANGKAPLRDGRKSHVGYFLVGKGRRMLERAARQRAGVAHFLRGSGGGLPLGMYTGAIFLTTAAITGLLIWWAGHQGVRGWWEAAWGVLLFLCVSRLALALVQWLSLMMVGPSILPRMDYSKGIPEAHRTIVVVPTLITDREEAKRTVEALEVRFLANRDENLTFALLTDFADAAQEKMPGDDALLACVCEGIESLNAKYGTEFPNSPGVFLPAAGEKGNMKEFGYFFLFHRPRRWNEKEQVWMGWERKRGKLEELNEALRGKTGRFDRIIGPVDRLKGIRYVITLDSDTQLPRDSARLLVGTMAHPLNRPHFDATLRRVTEGYGILQPRVGITIPSANRSRFAQLFAGDPGIDPYTHAVSDVYQDVFEEGSFVGKGIYDLDVFQQAVGGRFPENRVLSHDLLEGAHVRSGLVSDVLLFEECPSSYVAEVARRSRWTRGDWQIAPWLQARVMGVDGRRATNPISALSRWKILDNLRRSVMPAALLALLICGWFLPGGALFYLLVVIGILVLPAFLQGAMELTRHPDDIPFIRHGRMVARGIGRQILQEGFALACLPYEAYVNMGAICRAVGRMVFTGRGLLEWRTALDAERSAVTDLPGFFESMWVQAVVAAGVGIALAVRRPEALVFAVPVLLLWCVAPAIAFWLSRPATIAQPRLTDEDFAFLGKLSRRTWRFFETFVGTLDNYLPPDNFQEDPPRGIAHRTSPTNIGIALLANLAAYDFGYITIGEVMERTAQTLATLEKLQRHRGHFLNWYDTRTLEPLAPLYVSTVDSGNFAGHLLTLAAGLEDLASRRILREELFTGLATTLDIVLEAVGELKVETLPERIRSLDRIRETLRVSPTGLSEAYAFLNQASTTIGEFAEVIGLDADSELKWWVDAFARQCARALAELNQLAPWLAIPQAPGNGDEAKLDAGPALNELARMETGASEFAVRRIRELRELAERCREFAEVDYAFLYDKERQFLSIGYNVSDRRMDVGYYDLLASEARMASFVAIAQEKLPGEHWFHLGRSITNTGSGVALLSWSGSMFEYLMPLLIMPTHARTLLDETYRAVVRRQIEYGAERNVPWGISESGYNKTDTQGNFQYQAFGVPGLGLKRGLASELVIAPYATAMALMVYPEEACANLRRLDRKGLLHTYGFYEALDYGRTRLRLGQKNATVRSYMAHHQGMTFLSLVYVLKDRPMQRRFESVPAFQATELLLQERIPKAPTVFSPPQEITRVSGDRVEASSAFRIFNTSQTPVPEVHLLSNGRYHVAVTASGGGYSRWRDLAITRWREDSTRDCWGTFCYLRDVKTGEFWSATQQPTARRQETYEAIYSQGRAEFRRRDSKIETHLEISVSPEDDIELRRISITNRGHTPRTIEVTSYAEVVLAPPGADAAHPAFSNLFVQTQIIRKRQAILCNRRPRSAGERTPWMLHLMTVYGEPTLSTSYETSRAEFIGRGRSLMDPAAMHQALSDSEGAVLDPIVAVRNTVTIGPDETVRMHLVTGAAETQEAAVTLIEKYHDRRLADRVFELAWTQSQVMLQQLDATEADTQLFGRLASRILYSTPLMRTDAGVIARNRRGQSALWAYGISGDLPIVLLRSADQGRIQLVRQLVQAHAYWRSHGLAVDLVIWNEDQSGYRQSLQDLILEAITSRGEAALLDKPGGIFIRRLEQVSEEDKVLMQSVARVILSDTAGTLAEQLDRKAVVELPMPRFNVVRTRKADLAAPVKAAPHDLAEFNGIGGFTRDGREYVITSTRESPTPAPWSNVLANPWFGTVVSESGGAYTWCENAHSYRLTPWYNDAVSDTSGEAFYFRDEETGRYWSPSPLPARGLMPYTTRHGFGYSIFEYAGEGIASEMKVYVAIDAPVKFILFKVRNTSGRARRLSATGFFELAMGDLRETHAPHIVTQLDPKTGAILAGNAYNTEFADRVVFLDCSEGARTVTGDRGEFLGRNGSTAYPAGLSRTCLSGRVGAGMDPCAAMQIAFDLEDGQEREIAFTFGTGRNLADTRSLIQRFRGLAAARTAIEAVQAFWNKTLGAVQIETPDASVNFLANGWLLYQVVASRIWGRSGYYQSGGAFGFRDQLQDAMALVHSYPTALRDQIVRCSARQFREGDVQHWWHPPVGRGVRTRISDDYLWLPYAVCRYVKALNDTGVLEEKAQFLDGRSVKPEEDSYYDLPSQSEESATVYEHCVRAIKHGLRFGEHGLPLMGCGDWNDGMNLVGVHGKGESVWLAFFLYDVLMQFEELASRRQDIDFAALCGTEAKKLRENIEAHAWDGEWYRRAYFDNGEPLGSKVNPECRIDSIPQSWAILSGAAPPDRFRQAMAAVNDQLVKRNIGIIQLFNPPFDHSTLDPGYVKGYVPGVRENGGQYTHAAIWTVMAFAAAGDSVRAWELFKLINPVRHGGSETAIHTYKVEPYVIAADIYANPQHAGRGGWTWYTGSAGYMYRLIIESFIGLRLEANTLHFAPCLPAEWPSLKIHYLYRRTHYHIAMQNSGSGRRLKRLTVDGVVQADGIVRLNDDRKEHSVTVEIE